MECKVKWVGPDGMSFGALDVLSLPVQRGEGRVDFRVVRIEASGPIER